MRVEKKKRRKKGADDGRGYLYTERERERDLKEGKRKTYIMIAMLIDFMHSRCCDNATGLQPRVFDSTKMLPVCQRLSCHWTGGDPASLVYHYAHIKRWYLRLQWDMLP